MTARDRAVLRDEAARSRLEYAEWKQKRRSEIRVAPEPATPDAFSLTGDIAEYVTVLENFAADADDTELSQAVDALRSQVRRVGDVLTRRRRAYSEDNP